MCNLKKISLVCGFSCGKKHQNYRNLTKRKSKSISDQMKGIDITPSPIFKNSKVITGYLVRF